MFSSVLEWLRETHSNFILGWSLWSSTEVPMEDSWLALLSLRFIFASIAAHTAIRYWKEAREKKRWYRVMLRVQAGFFFGLVLYMLLKVLEVRYLTAPQLTWGTLLFYVLWIGGTAIPPITQLIRKGKEAWDGQERRQKVHT